MWHGVVNAANADNAAQRERAHEAKEKERREIMSKVAKTAAALSQVTLEDKNAEIKTDNIDFEALAGACQDIFLHGLKESVMQMVAQTSPYVRTWNIIELFGESHTETGGLVSQVMCSVPNNGVSSLTNAPSGGTPNVSSPLVHPHRRSAVQQNTRAPVAGNEHAMVQRFVRLCIINHQMQALIRFMVQEGVVVREFYEPWAILRSPEEIGICIDLLRTCQSNNYSADATANVLSDDRFRLKGNCRTTANATATAHSSPAGQPDVLARFAKFGSRQRRLLFGTSGVCAHVDAGGKLYGAVGYLSLMIENKHKVITWTPVLPFYEALTEVDSDEPKRVTLRTTQQTQTRAKGAKEVVPPSTHVSSNRRRRVMSTPTLNGPPCAQPTTKATRQTTDDNRALSPTRQTTDDNRTLSPTLPTGSHDSPKPTAAPAQTQQGVAEQKDSQHPEHTHQLMDSAQQQTPEGDGVYYSMPVLNSSAPKKGTGEADTATENTTSNVTTGPREKENISTETHPNTQTESTTTAQTSADSTPHSRTERAKSTPRALHTATAKNRRDQSEGLIPVRSFRIEVRNIEFLKYHRDTHGMYLHKPMAANTAEQKLSHTDTHAHRKANGHSHEAAAHHATTTNAVVDAPESPRIGTPTQISGTTNDTTTPSTPTNKPNAHNDSPKAMMVQGKVRTPVDKELDRGYLRIQPMASYDTGDPLPVLHFHNGNLNNFLGALKTHASKKKSKPGTQPLPKLNDSAADSGSNSDTGSQSSTSTHTYTPVRDEKDVKQEVFAALGWFKNTAENAYKAVTTVDSEQQRKREVAKRNKQRMLARQQSFTQVDRSNEEVYKTRREAAQLLYCDQSRTDLPRLSHISENVYQGGVTLEALGLGTDSDTMADEGLFRELVYFNGIHPTARGAVWRILLGLHPFGSDRAVRKALSRTKREEYWALKGRWLVNDGEAMTTDERDSVMAEREMIEKDVVRTDRTSTFMIGENNPNLAIMVEILVTYITYCPELGYVQGMSDLLAPLLQICENEADGFWCFVGYMEKMKSLYSIGNDIGIPQSILYLRQLLDVYDPDLHTFLEQQEVVGMFFTYRWFLLNFKREFDADAAIKLWEITWSEHITPYFNIFIAMAILISYRDPLLSGHLSGNDILEFVSQLANVMDCDKILALAKAYAGHSLHSSSVPPDLKASLYPKHAHPLEAGPDSLEALR